MTSFLLSTCQFIYRLCLIYIYWTWTAYDRLVAIQWKRINRLFCSCIFRRNDQLLASDGLGKVPNHLLIQASEHQANTKAFLQDCLVLCREYGIRWLTLMDGSNGKLAVELARLPPQAKPALHLFCNHKLMASQVADSASPSVNVNVITENQRQFFLRQLARISVEEPDFRFSQGDLLTKMTCNAFKT